MSLISKIYALGDRIKSSIFGSYASCYDRMEDEGHAVFGKCYGVAGGTAATDYLSEQCIGCPHWIPTV